MPTYDLFWFQQADSPFWKKKPQDKPAKPALTKTNANKRPAKEKTTEPVGSNIDDDNDDDESEVELDSLGSFLYISLTMIVIRTTQKPAVQATQR